jgi:hypothetical protein
LQTPSAETEILQDFKMGIRVVNLKEDWQSHAKFLMLTDARETWI